MILKTIFEFYMTLGGDDDDKSYSQWPGGLKLMPGQSIIEIILISPSQSNRLTINQGGNLNRGTF